MSYLSRLFNHRNAHSPEKKNGKPFFAGRQNDKGSSKGGFFQAKLSVNQPGDSYEKEADAVADAVVNKSSKAPVVQPKEISNIQRLSTPLEDEKLGTNDARILKDKEIQEKPMDMMDNTQEDEEKKKNIQKKDIPKEEDDEMKMPPSVQKKQDNALAPVSEKVLSRLTESGEKGNPLPDKTLSEMNSSFGADFSDVRIHTGSEATEMNKELRAQAFTRGNDIYFNDSKYNPGSLSGKHLLAHELTHTIQQSGKSTESQQPAANVQKKDEKEHDLQSDRFKGDPVLEDCFDNKRLLKFGDQGDDAEAIKKIQQAMIDDGIPMPISTKKTGTPDGIFQSETRDAVKAFQRKCGLTGKDIDGIVGPITMGLFDARFPPAQKPPAPAPVVPLTKKTVTVNIANLHGSTRSASQALAFANTIFKNQANIEIVAGTQKSFDETQTKSLLANDEMVEMHFFDKVASREERILFSVNQSSGAISMYFVKDITEENQPGKPTVEAVGYSLTFENKMGILGFVVGNRSNEKTFPHELGHVLLGNGNHTPGDNTLLMASGAPGFTLTAGDIAAMRNSPFAK